jgi:hypothetical protein
MAVRSEDQRTEQAIAVQLIDRVPDGGLSGVIDREPVAVLDRSVDTGFL